MKALDYYVLDVFTNSRYKGNQLSVVRIDEELSLTEYYDISREFGYSETSFVRYDSAEKIFNVRSFTQAQIEVVGAGHNLLGAVCLALLKKWDIFKGQKKPLSVMIKNEKVRLQITQHSGLPYVGMKQAPAIIIRSVPSDIIAIAVGLTVADLEPNGWRANIVRTEVGHLMVPVNNIACLKKAISQKVLLKAAAELFGFEGCYLFTTNQLNPDYVAEARFFNPLIGIDEDPATGTAAGPLAGYLEQLGYIKKDQDYKILQGVYVDHPSVIHVKVVDDGIWVSGSSVIVMEGKLYL